MIDRETWLEFQEWLAMAEHRVAIPFAEALARAIPPLAVRLRRDFGTILALIRAHAVLHQINRAKDAEGRILATIDDDYAVVRELVGDLVADGVDATVSPTLRETVEAVKALQEPGEESLGITVSRLAHRLKLDKTTALRRARVAIEKGFLKNLEDKKGRPARLVPGDPLPENLEILPSPEKLKAGCVVAATSREISPAPLFSTDPPPVNAHGSGDHLLAHLHKRVITPMGPGRLLQVLSDRVTVALDSDPKKAGFFKPEEVRPMLSGDESAMSDAEGYHE